MTSALYRLSLEYAPPIFAKRGFWLVRRCWKVDPRWADRVVDVDRRHTPKLRLRLLSPYAEPRNALIDPRIVLRHYWKQVRRQA
jgi:hypothetical protein